MTAYARSQLGNADRLVARHGHELRWCPDWNTWLAWDGTRWARDRGGHAHTFAIETARSIRAEAERASAIATPSDPAEAKKADEEKKARFRFATSSESASGVAAMLTLAQPALSVAAKDLDAKPLLLSTPSATVDLATGVARANDPSDLLTMATRTPFDPAAPCPRWDAFLRDVTDGDDDLVAYLRRVAGYAATGLSTERILVILHGPSASGKSTFLEVLRLILGDYAWVTPMSTLLGARTGGIPTDIAALERRRLVLASEADDRTPWDGATVKLLTGADTLTARRLYGEFFEFVPSHTIMIATNDIPAVRTGDEALVGRLHIVDFAAPSPSRPRDPRLRAALEAEAPGILAWVARGTREWFADGLRPPKAVAAARDRYRSAVDPVGAWLVERADLTDRGATCPAGKAFADYEQWCEWQDVVAAGERYFGDRLVKAGAVRRRGSQGVRLWAGLALRPAGRGE